MAFLVCFSSSSFFSTQLIQLRRRYLAFSFKTILPLFHAFFSLGTVIGAGIGALVAGARIGVFPHTAVIAVAIVVLAVVLPVYFVAIKPNQHNATSGNAASGSNGNSGSGTSGSGNSGSNGSGTKSVFATGGDGSTVTKEDGSTFTYKNQFGGSGFRVADGRDGDGLPTREIKREIGSFRGHRGVEGAARTW